MQLDPQIMKKDDIRTMSLDEMEQHWQREDSDIRKMKRIIKQCEPNKNEYSPLRRKDWQSMKKKSNKWRKEKTRMRRIKSPQGD